MASNLKHIKLQIGGMTCIHCQSRIEQRLRATGGVVSAAVSYQTGDARISYDADRISYQDIIAVIEQLDYQVLPEKGGVKPDFVRMVGTLIIIVCLYVLLEQFGVLNLLVPGQLAQSSMGYGMLFVTGLITSVHCIAMCGGINLSQCLPRETEDGGSCGTRRAFLPALLYNLGRVGCYTVTGFVLGLVGFLLGGGGQAGLPVLFQGVLKLAAGVFMLIMGVNMLGLFPWLRALTVRPPRALTTRLGAKRARATRPLAVGVLNGLMPCGPLQSVQIVALAAGNPFSGALCMLLFGLGTVPLMLGLGSLVCALGKKVAAAVNGIGAVLVAVLGLAMLSQGASLSGLLQPGTLLILIVALCVLAVTASIPFRKKAVRTAALAAVCAAAAAALICGSWMPGEVTVQQSGSAQAQMQDGVQVVRTTLLSGSYPDITVEAGTPVE